MGELRRARRRRSLGDQEWFDIAYRVYLVALVGGAAIIMVSDRVDDAVVTASDLASIGSNGPAVLGLVATVALAAGLRSGANGGPVALEPPDVRYLLLAPVDRDDVMRSPVVQRIRALAGGGALVGGIAGVLAARRLPGSAAAWAASGAAAGACSLALFAAAAVIAHVHRVPRAAVTAVGAIIVGLQLLAAVTEAPGPADTFGDLAMWGMHQRPVDLAAIAFTAMVVGVAVWQCGGLRVEALTRRADLVSQLRFAVTMQDLRTVILLRRQLRNEQMRSSRWPIPVPELHPTSSVGAAVRRRGWQSLARMPVARVLRSLGFAVAAGASVVVTLRGTTPAVLAIGASSFAMSLEVLEPLSQEVDHRDISGLSPVATDAVLTHLLPVSALALVPLALVAASVVAVFERGAATAAYALAVPCAWVGACGAVVSVVGEGRSSDSGTGSAMMVPEFAGFATAMRTVLPLVVSTLSAIPVLALRQVGGAGVALRTGVVMLLVVAACVWWVRKHSEYGERWRRLLQAGRG